MATTLTFTADAVGDPEPVIVQTVCKRVRIVQNGRSGISDYLLYKGSKAAVPVTKVANEISEFFALQFFMPGDIPGYVALLEGSEDFAQEED